MVTVGRSDYGVYRPVLRRILERSDLELHLIVAGMHFASRFGTTINEIESDGIPIGDRIDFLLATDSPEAIAKSMGLGLIGFAQSYGRRRPDMLVVLGDRFEMHSAALAAVPFGIPIAHLHGGEITEGAIDDALRHSITKLSHLHFVATETYATRIRQMGEEAWRVVVSGAPSLDNMQSVPRLSPDELRERFGVSFDRAPLLVTFHPVTLEPEHADSQTTELLEALRTLDLPIVFTMPNADTGGQRISDMIERFVRETPSACLIPNLGTAGYFSLMELAAAMVGNSSSGIVEAPSFGLPVVNIGARQRGRQRAANVIDVEPDRHAIRAGIAQAVSPAFRASLNGRSNPYGDGRASSVIVDRLASQPLGPSLLVKKFANAAIEG